MSQSKPGPECLRLADAFSDVVDGIAPVALVNEAVEHMKDCSYCEKEFAQFKETVEACRKAQQPLPSKRCRERLMDLFRRFQPQGESR